MTTSRITLHVERVVLDGLLLSSQDGACIQAALERELTRLLQADGLAAGLHQGGSLARLAGRSIDVDAAVDPAALGVSIARAVYGSIGGRPPARSEATDSARGGART